MTMSIVEQGEREMTMNGDDQIMKREMGNIIENVEDSKGASGCHVHTKMAEGVVKSLRYVEAVYCLQKKIIALLILMLLSIWAQGVDMSSFIKKLITILCGG